MSENMTYGKALDLLLTRQAKRISRRVWGGWWYLKDVPGLNHPIIIAHLKNSGGEDLATPYPEDKFADDWYVME